MTDMTNAGAGGAPVPDGVLAAAAAATAAYLRLPDPTDASSNGDEGALLRRLAAVSIGVAEAYLGRLLIARTIEDVVVADGAWRRLAAEPVRAIAGITALPTGAAPTVLPVDGYRIDIAADGAGWVRVVDGGGAALAAVAYRAGLATDWASIPAPIAQGLVATTARLFVDRDAPGVPAGDVAALWRPFRRLHLTGGRR